MNATAGKSPSAFLRPQSGDEQRGISFGRVRAERNLDGGKPRVICLSDAASSSVERGFGPVDTRQSDVFCVLHGLYLLEMKSGENLSVIGVTRRHPALFGSANT